MANEKKDMPWSALLVAAVKIERGESLTPALQAAVNSAFAAAIKAGKLAPPSAPLKPGRPKKSKLQGGLEHAAMMQQMMDGGRLSQSSAASAIRRRAPIAKRRSTKTIIRDWKLYKDELGGPSGFSLIAGSILREVGALRDKRTLEKIRVALGLPVSDLDKN